MSLAVADGVELYEAEGEGRVGAAVGGRAPLAAPVLDHRGEGTVVAITVRRNRRPSGSATVAAQANRCCTHYLPPGC